MDLLITLLILPTLILANSVDKNFVVKHLEEYGYLKSSNNSIVNLEEALAQFQDYYNLNVTGEITEELVNFMQKPRCSLPDDRSFTLQSRWDKNTINWYIQPFFDGQAKKIADYAFNEWQKVTNLRFTYSIKNPDIIISFGSFAHKNSARCKKGNCASQFDGSGQILGHATFPNHNHCQEIHLDESENWYLGLDVPDQDGKISLYAVILHEIGHNLGLAHSAEAKSIMYAYFSVDSFYGKTSIELNNDDVMGIQYLYGKPPISTAPISTTIKPISKPKKVEQTTHPTPNIMDLCQIEYPEKMLVTNNNHLYIFHKDLVWILKIGEDYGINLKKPRKISDYLGAYEKFSHIYQKPNSRIVLINNQSFSTLFFPSLAYEAFNVTINNFDIPKYSKINAIFNSNMGRTFILYDDWYFTEFDECSSKTINRGIIKEQFSGIPLDITSAFRYINGNIYFFKNNLYYEFNEFSRKLIRAGSFDWSLFGINCPNETILNQLKNILTTLSKYFSN